MKRLINSLIGMFLYSIVAYGGNIATGLAKYSSFKDVFLESIFFGIFVFLFQSFKLKIDDHSEDSSNKPPKQSQ
ncbi:hypothetical protein [Vagococcus humatus]|uniref:DUF2929 domain-containing protein n=1 Tax=Vagococcus humatus TaxID=1889241 RepID=A0A3S0ACM4_9ENTE|nr:hypothetical protein [Vagococcus humatus]RST89716.1 hypothetical protein C7P63_01165 [Vagococcus humatus]